jgi:hypothetical protein
VENALDEDAWAVFPVQAVGQRANRYLLDHGWKDAAEQPAGPGLGEPLEEPSEPVSVPDVSAILVGPDAHGGEAVPFLAENELALIGRAEVDNGIERWFVFPDPVVGDFAVQMPDTAMGATLPFGAIAVFRPDGPLVDAAIVIADVAAEGDESRHVIRRLELVRGGADDVVGIRLTADVPGLAHDYEFFEPYAEGRVRAVLVDFQEM